MVKSKFEVNYLKVHNIYEFISVYLIILLFHFQAVLYILVEWMIGRLMGLSNTRTKNGNFLENLPVDDGVTVQSKWDQPSTPLVE